MIPINEKLKAIFIALNTTPHKFLIDHQFNRMTIYNIVGGRTKPGLEILERLCQAEPRISAEYLLRGEGPPLRDPGKASSTARQLRGRQAHSSINRQVKSDGQ
ncbi:hypothetical protein SD10_13085 [Spirosoma radiotolerans]|uniref:XRE family transcriptional regulator n=1 Tax=Spirosoma radiotolerans TaxID=1379870 RepID=A0A0E3V7S3_9BACT|nr:hypothetical protein SD10_13085 [Spirosoma radiotolerans]